MQRETAAHTQVEKKQRLQESQIQVPGEQAQRVRASGHAVRAQWIRPPTPTWACTHAAAAPDGHTVLSSAIHVLVQH